MRDGLREERNPRKVHDSSRIAKLLVFPHYADALEQDKAGNNNDENDSETPQQVALVTSAAAWHRELAKWKGNLEDELDLALASDDKDEP